MTKEKRKAARSERQKGMQGRLNEVQVRHQAEVVSQIKVRAAGQIADHGTGRGE